jgi:NAD(P)-dependent dehydrogenase (short-subunit alcohol dehydrogenase family)
MLEFDLMSSVLITGTSKGIGLATALAFGRAGLTVFAAMRNPERSPELAETARKEQLPIRILSMDVDSDISVRDTIGTVQSQNGPLDVLINNAGIVRRGSIEELPVSEFRALMETNYFGALRCIQAVMPEMRKRKNGCIVNVSSVGGRISSPPLTPYAASKWALEALSEGLAQEAKIFNVRVLVVEPGIINTGMAQTIAREPGASAYPHARRMAGLFASSLEKPTPPTAVAEKILDIVQGGTWKFRHTAGPDAEAYLQARASMTDEQWIDRGAGLSNH